MVRPTSEKTDKLDKLDRLCGVVDKRPGHCDEHGDFVDVLHRRVGSEGTSEGWGGCPECAHRARQEKRLSDEQNRLADIARDRIDHYQGHAGIYPKFAAARFENYQPVNDKAARNLEYIQRYGDVVSSPDHGGRCLILSGNVGAGKTHLCCALLRDVIDKTAQPCFYVSFDEMVNMFRETMDRTAGCTERELIARFARYRLLVIDEVGLQKFSDYELTVAYKVINARYQNERPTVLATNVNANNLKNCIGERAVDRLRENGGRALVFDWMSYRDGGSAA